MLQTQTIAPATLQLLTRFMQDSELRSFRLVGGTALALQLGHRISVDLDLFTDTAFDEQQLREYLERNYGMQTDYMSRSTVKGEIDGVQIDCIAHEYPWLQEPTEEDGIRLACLPDICAMKLNAISGNGTRIKDFIDVAWLSAHYTLNEMLDFYEHRYNANVLMPLKAIIFFDEINFDEPVHLTNGKKVNWKMYEKRLLEMEKHPDKLFPALAK